MGSVKPSWPEKGASCTKSAYAVYFIKSGDCLHGEHLWVDGSSRDCWN